MKKTFTLLLTLLFVGVTISQNSEDINFENAEKLYEEKKYKKAIHKLDTLLKNNPKIVGAYIFRGKSKSNLKQHIDAIKDYKKAIKLDSLNTLAFFEIGKNYNNLLDYNTAIIYFNKAKNKLKYGKSYLRKLPLKRSFLKEVTPLQVEEEDILYNRGLSYFNLEKYELAFKNFSSIIDDKYDKDSQFMLGVTLLKLNKTDESCKALEKAIILGSKKADSLKQNKCS